MSIVKKLHTVGKLSLSKDFMSDLSYEGISGSTAYAATTNNSDMDIYGICMLPLEMAFPHRTGYIKGFGPAPETFETLNQHHIMHEDKEYDVCIISIVKFFNLAAENNPNIVDVLFLPERCVTFQNEVGRHMRVNRQQFLHKGAIHKFLGYAHSQLKKVDNKVPTGKRKELVDKFGVDVKYLSHLFRLTLECEQILCEGDLNLEKNGDIIKSVKNGMYTLDEAKAWFKEKELTLQKMYVDSSLPYSPNWSFLRKLLLQCFEIHYGSLNEFNYNLEHYQDKLNQIKKLCEY